MEEHDESAEDAPPAPEPAPGPEEAPAPGDAEDAPAPGQTPAPPSPASRSIPSIELELARALLERGGTGWLGAAEHITRGWLAVTASAAVDGLESALESALPDLLGGPPPSHWRASLTSTLRCAEPSAWPELADHPDASRLRRDVERQAVLLDRVVHRGRRGLLRHWRAAVTGLIVLGLIPLVSALVARNEDPAPPAPSIPGEVSGALDQLATPRANGDPWDGEGNLVFAGQALVDLGRTWRPTAIEISVDHNDHYLVEFRAGDEISGAVELTPVDAADAQPGLIVRNVPLPPTVTEAGADRVIVRALSGDEAYAVGHLLLTE